MLSKGIAIRLAAEGGKQLKAELKSVGITGQRSMKGISREARIATARLHKFAMGVKIAGRIVGVAMVAGLTAMVKHSLDTIDAQAKLAASMGTTTASMQVLTRAAELAGVSQGEVQQATIMMTKSLSQAARGTGPAVQALQALHLSASDLSKLTIDKKMSAIQDAIAKFIPTAEQAAVASQIFGSRAGLIFTRIDSATLRQATQDVQDFGIAVSEQDAAKIQTTNDALSRMGLLWTGIANRLSIAVAPALKSFADWMAKIGKTTGPLGVALNNIATHIGAITRVIASFATLAAGRFVTSMAAAALGIRGVGLSLTAIKVAVAANPLGLILTAATALVSFAPQITQALNNWLNPQTKLQQATANAVTAMGDEITQSQLLDGALHNGAIMSSDAAVQKLKEAKSRYDNVAAIIAEQRAMALGSKDYANLLQQIKGQQAVLNSTGFPSLDVAPARLRDAFDAAQTTLAALRVKQQDLLKTPKKMADELALTTANISKIETALAKAKNGVVSFRGSLITPIIPSIPRIGSGSGGKAPPPPAPVAAKTAWEAARKAVNDYAKTAKDVATKISDVIKSAFASAENAIGNFVKTGKLDFSSLISSMLADIAKLAARKFILGPIAKGLGKVFDGFASASVHHGGGIAGGAAPMRQIPAMALAGAQRYHNGGYPGLRPDEIPAILQRGERVLSRRETAQYGQGGQNITINIQTRDAESFRQSRAQISADIARAVSAGRRGM